MPQTHIIGIVGMQGAGKSYASEYIRRTYGGDHIKLSDCLSDVLKVLSLKKTRDNQINLSVILRQGFGEDIMSHATAARAKSSEGPVVLIDGIRRVEDLESFKTLPNFMLIAVEADPNVRFERQTMRREKTDDAQLTWEKFQEIEQAPTEVTIPDVLAKADKTITNNGSKEEFEAKTDELMAELGIQKKG